jgi:hypothetical protein
MVSLALSGVVSLMVAGMLEASGAVVPLLVAGDNGCRRDGGGRGGVSGAIRRGLAEGGGRGGVSGAIGRGVADGVGLGGVAEGDGRGGVAEGGGRLPFYCCSANHDSLGIHCLLNHDTEVDGVVAAFLSL